MTRASTSWLWFLSAYAGMILATTLLFLLVRSYGEALVAPPPSTALAASGANPPLAPNLLLHVLLALAAVLIIGRLLGRLVRFIGQPPVIGEVLAGMRLGPSLLGHVAPGLAAYLLPVSVAPFLSVIAQLGVILYMFLIGLELNAGQFGGRANSLVAISHASIVLPFTLGSTLALLLYPRLSTSAVPFTSFALFMGVSMSITAFPVLARILTDRGISRTELGVMALACAAVDDVTAWCLLAFVVGVVQASIDSAVTVALLTVTFVGVMFLLVRPMVARLVQPMASHPPTAHAIAIVLVGVLLSALTTEQIGVHAIFGAFLFGAVIPHDSHLARTLTERLEDLVTILLLPAFFAITGMRTEIGLLTDLSQWLICGLIILVATAGKFGGTLVAARLTGVGRRDAIRLGILMNTRGLMELIVLNIGLDLGVITPTLFTMLVIMALATTVATTPLLLAVGSVGGARFALELT